MKLAEKQLEAGQVLSVIEKFNEFFTNRNPLSLTERGFDS